MLDVFLNVNQIFIHYVELGLGCFSYWASQVALVGESIPRQVDKKSGVPKEEKGVCGSQGGDRGLEFSRRRKGQMYLFSSTFLSHLKCFFFN